MPRRRRRGFVLVAAGLVALAVELLSAAAWSVQHGRVFSWGRAAEARDAARLDRAGNVEDRDAAAVQQATAEPVVLHPFLGYVYDAGEPKAHAFPVSRFGFVDDASPLRPAADDRFVVALVGGSVALQLALYAGDELADALAASPALEGRRVELLRLGLGGYKQPQQLFAIAMLLALGGHVDCVVNLDGFNEIALPDENQPLGVPEWYPRSWARLVDAAPQPEQLLRLGELALLRQQRGESVATAESLWWSPTAQVLWSAADRRRVARMQELQRAIERAPAEASFAATGPGSAPTLGEARARMVELWARCSRQLDALCRAHGAVYCHFLQPNQYVPGKKPIGDAERLVAVRAENPWGRAVVDFYPALQQKGRELAATGVAFSDLTGIFAAHPEPLYSDSCCHLNREGNRLLARHVAAGVRRQLDLRGVSLVGLRAEPQRLAFASPMPTQLLRVLGVDESGREHDVSGPGFGVEFGCEPAGLVVVEPDGRLRAVRRGEGVLHIGLGRARVDVPFAAGWPSTWTADDGAVGPGGERPALLATEAPRAGQEIEVQVAGLPPGGVCLLASSGRPLPPTPVGASADGVLVAPLAPEAGRAVARVPLAGAGEPRFVRVYALGPDLSQLVATSATLVLTPE